MRLQRQSPTFLNRCIVGAAGPGGLWGNVNPGEIRKHYSSIHGARLATSSFNQAI